jgi:2-oxo-hept-3-ene-1,7-dioate hydratase
MAISLTAQQIDEVAVAHEHARRVVAPIRRVTHAHPALTIDDAYAIQKAWVDLQVDAGSRIIGHKIGLTSRAMQQAMNIDEPDFGVLLDNMAIESGAVLHAADFVDPKIEVELAFVLRDRVDAADVTVDDVLAATAYVTPALELIDARSYRRDPEDGATRTVRDTISDNAANAGVVTGGHRLRAGEIDLRWVSAILKRNGIVEETGVAAGVLDDPVRGIVWLARRLHGFGVALEPGQIILAGSFTRPVDCRAGDRFDVDFGDSGAITVEFD